MLDLDEFLEEELGYTFARPGKSKKSPHQVWGKREPSFPRLGVSREDAVRRLWKSAMARHAERWPMVRMADIEELLPPPDLCPILGVVLDYNGMRAPNAASIDRIDNSRGYVRGNVKIVCNHANRLKSNGTAAEHLAIAAYMQKHGAA